MRHRTLRPQKGQESPTRPRLFKDILISENLTPVLVQACLEIAEWDRKENTLSNEEYAPMDPVALASAIADYLIEELATSLEHLDPRTIVDMVRDP